MLSLSSLLLPSLLLAGPCGPGRLDDRGGDPVLGQRVFVEAGCVRCHAVRGAGGRIGPDLGRRTRPSSYAELAAAMWNHSPTMAEKMRELHLRRPTLEGDQLADLISFLYFLNYFDEPGDVTAGRLLFREKGCISCHRAEGEGGDTGPALDGISRGASPLSIASSLWNHGPAMAAAVASSGMELPTFAGAEILDLFAYLRSIGRRQGAPRFESAGDPVRGEELFTDKNCAACHGVFADPGEELAGPDLGRSELRGSVTVIAGRMWNHWPQMASRMEEVGMEVPQLTAADLGDIFAFIYQARFVGEPGDPVQGRTVFEAKGCAVCHGADGEGGVGPALRPNLAGRGPEEVLQAMWNHAPAMQTKLEAKNLSWVELTPKELTDLTTFLAAGLPAD
ncbi:MAG: hypothetical protein D6702_07545 [Planctomycetota bacterium]|nr:MAG: hypothetical protein D6702_07545 [Planctomycetota bacterium]